MISGNTAIKKFCKYCDPIISNNKDLFWQLTKKGKTNFYEVRDTLTNLIAHYNRLLRIRYEDSLENTINPVDNDALTVNLFKSLNLPIKRRDDNYAA